MGKILLRIYLLAQFLIMIALIRPMGKATMTLGESYNWLYRLLILLSVSASGLALGWAIGEFLL